MLTSKQTPRVVFQPDVHRALQRGIYQVVSAVRPTLGPIARTVAVDHINKTKDLPEILDEGGVIARRLIELPDRDEDMGAMLLRSMLVEQYEQVGDGTATAAVLFEAIFNEGVRYVAAGGNATQLRKQLERMLPDILNGLDHLSHELRGQQSITHMANSLCHDEELAALLGEAFDLMGEFGRIEIREGYGRGNHLEYVQGVYYETGLISRAIVPDDAVTRMVLKNPSVFICDFTIEDHRELYPVLQNAFQLGITELVIVLRNLSEQGVAMLATNNKMDKLKTFAVKVPGLNETDRMAALDDLAVLTGATPILKATGDVLENVTADHFGRVRSAWADLRAFGFSGNGGDPKKIRNHIHALKHTYYNTTEKFTREAALKRVGILLGGSVTLWVGGHTEPEIKTQKSLAVRTARTLRVAVENGVIPGGGVALMHIAKTLGYQSIDNPDHRAAVRILTQALKAPARTIYENAGYDPSEVLAKLSFADDLAGFNVIDGCVEDHENFKTLDSLTVLKTAVANAVRTASLALTIDSLVHMRDVQMVKHPDGTSD